jgi:hypothetical protein
VSCSWVTHGFIFENRLALHAGDEYRNGIAKHPGWSEGGGGPMAGGTGSCLRLGPTGWGDPGKSDRHLTERHAAAVGMVDQEEDRE